MAWLRLLTNAIRNCISHCPLLAFAAKISLDGLLVWSTVFQTRCFEGPTTTSRHHFPSPAEVPALMGERSRHVGKIR